MNRTLSVLALAACIAFAGIAGETKPAETPAAVEKKEAAPATTSAGSAVAQNMPTFPLKSENFAQIDDEVVIPFDGPPEAAYYNTPALLDILPAIQASTQEHLKANVDRTATFKKIFNHPEDYRGHVVQFESTLKFVYTHPENLKDAQGKLTPLARGHASTSYQPITYLSLEPLPAGMKIDDPVLVTGVYLQRFCYENSKMPGRQLSWTPLIIVKRLEPMVIKEEAPTSYAFLIGNILFAMVAVGLLMLYANRQSYRVARNNVFTRMKNERDGGPRLFPGPSGNFKKK